MLLQYLIEKLEKKEIIGETNIDVGKVEYDSSKVQPKDVFVSIKGFEFNGNDFLEEVVQKQVSAIVVEENVDTSNLNLENITLIKVESTRKALALMSAVYYDFPASKLKIIGVTGTKGKTTTAHMIRDILLASGKKTGMIGTIYNTYGNVKQEATRTSPESLDLQKMLYDMVNADMEFVVMEVSSHALELDRVYGIRFNVGVFTNLAEEHLDFHENMDNYFNAKSKLFEMSDFAIINGDDIYAPRLKKKITTKYATYGLDNEVNLTATDIRVNADHVEFKMYINKMLETIHINIPGRFTVYNALAAIGVCSLFSCQMDAILLALANVKVPGRSEVVDINKTFTVMLDYAHNPSSLEAILTAIKKHAKSRIICVFGCGGDRDKTKRPVMGEIAGRLADFTVITTDNPRNENPKQIMNEIEAGIKNTRGLYKVIENRKEAIKFAMRIAWKNDIVLIAGKGHETYQILKNNKKINFDERKIVKELAEQMEGKNIE